MAITKRSLANLKPGKTDWARLRAMTDEDIDRAIREDPDAAPISDAAWFERAQLVLPEPKTAISLRVDREVLDFFKSQGAGYQTRMNAVLRAYAEAHADKAPPQKTGAAQTTKKKSGRR